jgi:hypothetical protein
MTYMTDAEVIKSMVGKTFTSVRRIKDDRIEFVCDEGTFTMHHHQSCCESVYIESVVGDLDDLVGSPILVAESPSSLDDDDVAAKVAKKLENTDDDFAPEFYKFATRKGYVDIRWYGSSNGYYSESVDIEWQPA